MSVESRTIVAPDDRERTAVVAIALPAGGEVDIDPTWRFLGWKADEDTDESDDLWLVPVTRPARVVIDGDDEEGWTVTPA